MGPRPAPGLGRTGAEQTEFDVLEAAVADADDRAHLQGEARQRLAADGEPVTRFAVARRANQSLQQQEEETSGAVAGQVGQVAGDRRRPAADRAHRRDPKRRRVPARCRRRERTASRSIAG